MMRFGDEARSRNGQNEIRAACYRKDGVIEMPVSAVDGPAGFDSELQPLMPINKASKQRDADVLDLMAFLLRRRFLCRNEVSKNAGQVRLQPEPHSDLG